MPRQTKPAIDMSRLDAQTRAYICWLEGQNDAARAGAARLTVALRAEELKVEALRRALDAAEAGRPLPFTPEPPPIYTRHCPVCDQDFDRRGFVTHFNACIKRVSTRTIKQ